MGSYGRGGQGGGVARAGSSSCRHRGRLDIVWLGHAGTRRRGHCALSATSPRCLWCTSTRAASCSPDSWGNTA